MHCQDTPTAATVTSSEACRDFDVYPVQRSSLGGLKITVLDRPAHGTSQSLGVHIGTIVMPSVALFADYPGARSSVSTCIRDVNFGASTAPMLAVHKR